MTVFVPQLLLWQYMTRPIKQPFLHQKQAELHSIQRGGLQAIFVHLGAWASKEACIWFAQASPRLKQIEEDTFSTIVRDLSSS